MKIRVLSVNPGGPQWLCWRLGCRSKGGRTASQTDGNRRQPGGGSTMARCRWRGWAGFGTVPQNAAAELEQGVASDPASVPSRCHVPAGCWWGPPGTATAKVTSTSAAWDPPTPTAPKPTSVPPCPMGMGGHLCTRLCPFQAGIHPGETASGVWRGGGLTALLTPGISFPGAEDPQPRGSPRPQATTCTSG